MSALAILFLAIIAYFAVLTATLLLSQPLRVRVVSLGEELLEQPGLSKEERAHVEWLINSSSSSVVGIMIPVAAVSMLVAGVLGATLKQNPRLAKLTSQPEYDELSACYVGSVMACSPFAAMVSVPLIIAGVTVLAIRGDRHLVTAAEAPVMRASVTFQPA